MSRYTVKRLNLKYVILLICLSAIVGCASSSKMAMPGMTQDQWDRDYYECNAMAHESIGFDAHYKTQLGNVIASGSEHERLFDSCCEAKGYRKVSEEEYNQILGRK